MLDYRRPVFGLSSCLDYCVLYISLSGVDDELAELQKILQYSRVVSVCYPGAHWLYSRRMHAAGSE